MTKNNPSGKMPETNLDRYFYDLPKEKIADYPLEDRASGKLLVADVNTGEIKHKVFSDISEIIPKDTILVLNTTKVIAARIFMKKPTGGKVELLCVDPVSPSVDPQVTMLSRNTCQWKCLVGGRNLNPGMLLTLDESVYQNIKLTAELIDRVDNEALVKFTYENFIAEDKNMTFADVLDIIGNVPLPPYIKREAEEEDKERYQTVYAEADGSVAAPTAGLHFTPEVLSGIKKKGIEILNVNLHVGPGTFKPIDGNDISDHNMHVEQFSVSTANIKAFAAFFNNNPNSGLTATGTTSLRTIESMYWIGVKLLLSKGKADVKDGFLTLSQFESYEITESEAKLPDCAESFSALAAFADAENLSEIHCKTQLFIVPGYDIKTVKTLITNYHMPKSTLILLVATFAGYDLWRKIYNAALGTDYRFLSYGDSSVLLR
ncbi:MAG: S-adenosylmethionine:tRNA ribosyltransferase-isomerase [Chlorobi bacterium]|nr:S-adenosylmethionine:tRNA ribosyltransferase-isomerase [Chlorobiota bacterium]